jgi:hypothetical protein
MENREQTKDFMSEKDQMRLEKFNKSGAKEIEGPYSRMFIHSKTISKEHKGSIEAIEARGARGVSKEVIRVNQRGIEKKNNPLNTATEGI